VGSPLDLWNQVVLVKALEKVSVDDPKRTPDEQKVGDYYYACMDTKTIEAETANLLKQELARIAEMTSKREIAAEVAHLHQTIPGANIMGDNQTRASLLGFSAQPDYADATRDVATIDQGGMGLPAKDGKTLNTKGPDGFTELQRFFLSYAFSWCEYYRPELIRTQVLTNPHSYPKYRVNNVVSNFPEFWEAFGCHDGQKWCAWRIAGSGKKSRSED
jgi:predicted metalloendopeptidase